MDIMAIKELMILKKIFIISNREKKIEEKWTKLQRPVRSSNIKVGKARDNESEKKFENIMAKNVLNFITVSNDMSKNLHKLQIE